jgi:hypothetical protein
MKSGEPCGRCHAFVASADTGICEWCTAEPKMCQCPVCVKRRANGLAKLLTRPRYHPDNPRPPHALPATPIKVERASAAANAAYRNGGCKTCLTEPHRAGCTECDSCWSARTGHNPNSAPRTYGAGAARYRSSFDDFEPTSPAAWTWTDPATWPAGIAELNTAYRAAMDTYPRCSGCARPLLAPIPIERGHCEACTPIGERISATYRYSDHSPAAGQPTETGLAS